jgi:hypothetical protein
VKIAQVRLGHANPQTTLNIYAQATEPADRAAADKVGDRFRPRDAAGAQRLGEADMNPTRPRPPNSSSGLWAQKGALTER